jgi:hypothetical protein
MIKHTTILAASFAVLASFASSANAAPAPFTGSIDIKITAPQDSGGVARFHMSDVGVATEVDMAAQMGAGPAAQRLQTRTLTKKNGSSFWIIDDKTKSYREIALDAVRESQRRPASETWTVKKIGDETVAGYPAQHIVATSSKGQKLELWTTTAIGNDAAFEEAWTDQAKLSPSLMGALERNGLKGIPAKVLAATPQGPMGIEIVAVKKGAPSKKLFEVPADYTKLQDPIAPRGAGMQPRQPARDRAASGDGKMSL